MATQRRTNATEKTQLDQDETKSQPKSNITPAVPSYVSLNAIFYGEYIY